MKKIGIIGDKDSVLGFMSVGFSVFAVNSSEKAARILDSAISDGFAVMYVTEEILLEIPRYTKNIKPNRFLP